MRAQPKAGAGPSKRRNQQHHAISGLWDGQTCMVRPRFYRRGRGGLEKRDSPKVTCAERDGDSKRTPSPALFLSPTASCATCAWDFRGDSHPQPGPWSEGEQLHPIPFQGPHSHQP